MKETYIRWGMLLASTALFAGSLTQKCYCTTDVCGDSLAVLIMGAGGLFVGGAALCWFANPFLVCSWFTGKKNLNVSLGLSLAATIIALSFLFFNTILDDEGGHYKKIVSYQAGYWLWTSSCVVMLGRNLILKKLNTKS